MQDLDDCKRELTKILKASRTGGDVKELQISIAAVKAFAEIHVAQIKHDPKEEAKKEFARGLARKAAEQIDLSKAKEILTRQNFLALEDHMGLLNDEREIRKGDEVLEQVKVIEKEILR